MMAPQQAGPPAAPRDLVAPAAFFGGAVLAGGNAVCIRFSNRELAPVWGAGFRFVLAAALLLGLMAVFQLPLPRGRALAGAVIYGALNFGGSFGLAYYALLSMRAGFGQTLLAMTPLATLLFAVAQRQERLRAAGVAGALLAAGGVAVMTRAPLAEPVPALAIVAALGSVCCFAEAAVLVRWFPPVHPVVMNGVGMTAGALLLIVWSFVAGEPHALPARAETWVAVSYLVMVGSVVVFVLYLVVLQRWQASRAAFGFVLIPFVTVALSAWLDDERITAGFVIGGLLVLAGVYVGALRKR